MHDQPPTAVQNRIIELLRELTDALDRRVPRVERVGELDIAREAAALKKAALRRIDELTHAAAQRQDGEARLAAAIMSDDGGPPAEYRDQEQHRLRTEGQSSGGPTQRS